MHRARSSFVVGLVLTVLAVVALGAVAHAAGTPEQQCNKGRYAARAKYLACLDKAFSRALGEAYGPGFYARKCRPKYQATWAKLQRAAAGTGSSCDSARFVDNGDGTVTDNLTELRWEQKTDDGSIHDKDDRYSWTVFHPSVTPDGTVFTSFLSTLNAGCFAGQCDWRLPTASELQTIIAEPCSQLAACVDPIFGTTAFDLQTHYWASTTAVEDPRHAYVGEFTAGELGRAAKSIPLYARAVRGGL